MSGDTPSLALCWAHQTRHRARGAVFECHGFAEPEVLAIDHEQVEGADDRVRVAPMRADELEHGQTAVAADDRLAIDHARA
jgi:hypothetical protein